MHLIDCPWSSGLARSGARRVGQRDRPSIGQRRTVRLALRWCAGRLGTPDQMSLLGGAEFGWLEPQSAFRVGDLHALPRPHPDEVRLEFGDHGQHVEQQSPDRSFGSYSDPPMLSSTSAVVSSSTMSQASGRERARRSSLVTMRVSPERQAAHASRSPGRSRFHSGQAVIDVDPVGLHAEGSESVVLGGEVLGVGRATGTSWAVPLKTPSPGIKAGRSYGNVRREFIETEALSRGTEPNEVLGMALKIGSGCAPFS